MNEKQAAMIGELMKRPEFAMLQGLCSEVSQAQDNALNNKHKALHMQMITFTNKALDNLNKNHRSSGLGSSAPAAGSNSGGNSGRSSGLGSGAPSNAPSNPSNGVGASQGNGGEFNPANWDVAKYGVDHYIKTLYYLYDKLRTTESGNPNALLFFLEGLGKLSSYGGSALLTKFTNGLMGQMSAFSAAFSPQSGKQTNPVPFYLMIAFALATLAMYQASRKGGSMSDATAQIEQYINGPLGGSNPFLSKIKNTLERIINGGVTISPVPGVSIRYSLTTIRDMIFAHGGADTDGTSSNSLPIVSKIFLQQILQSLFGGDQGSNDSDAIDNSQAAVREAFSEGILAELNKMEKGGATLAELIDFVMMQYNLSSDDAGAYVGNINDLSALEGDTSTLLGLFAPEKYVVNSPDFMTEIRDFMTHLGAYYRLTDMWPTAPNITGGGEGSIEDILTGQLMDNLGSLKCGADVMKRLGMPNASGNITWRGLSFNTNSSFKDLMSQFKTLFLSNPNSKQAQNAAQLLITIIQQRNSEPENTSGSDHINKRDSALDSIVSSLQAVQSQTSSSNETAKAEYQQANQTSANMLSTGGDMMKDLMKMFSTSVQNERAGV